VSRLRRLPLRSLLLAVTAAVIATIPGSLAALQLDRESLQGGQVWRLWTSHLAHAGSYHLLGDALALVALGFLFGPRRPDPEKLSPYECGFEAFEDSRMKFDVRYYLVAILFILFDLEIAFLFPWAIVLEELGVFGFWAMVLFLAILVVGFIYEWMSGALEWE